MSDPSPSTELLHFNGINGATGDYGLPPMTGEQLTGFVQGQGSPDNLEELKLRHRQGGQAHFGLKAGVDPKKLDETGWGIIVAHDADPAILDALRPLLDLRHQQAGALFRVYQGSEGYRPNESKADFLARQGMGPGPADPAKLPYYLLIVGSPDAIPYRFQFQLDVQYAVGRLWFDAPQGFANYARSVVAAETGQLQVARQVRFFGVANPDDRATALSSDLLVRPLFKHLSARQPGWDIAALLGDEATKARLGRLLGGDDTPALLFTASHGMEFPIGDPRQLRHQGALLCQDWPGPKAWQGRGPIPQDHYFAGDDLHADARLLGLISFHFACYGAGTPRDDEFAKQAFKARKAIAPQPFVADLPTRLLSHPRGGALAVIGHVERAWGYSFLWPGAGSQTTVFESTLERLLEGYPVGAALEYFNERYAELASDLSVELEDIEFGLQPNPDKLAGLWTSNNDARSYVIIGDPAVRLPVAPADQADAARSARHLAPLPMSAGADAPAAVQFGLGGAPIEPAVDALQFSAYHPRSIAPGPWHPLLVYAHLASALDEVAIDAGQTLGQAAKTYRQGLAQATMAIAVGTRITLVPAAAGLVFQPAQASLVWAGRWQRASFQVQATGEGLGHVVQGSVACYVGPLLIADIPLPIVLASIEGANNGLPASPDRQVAKMYPAIFASYAHADTAIVEAVETAYKALGMDYLRDVVTLKSGQNWSDELLRMIDSADIFQLFWSSAASQSAYVEQEWRHALGLVGRKGPAFIRPVYWAKTVPAVPQALSSLHFAPVEFAGLADPVAGAAPVASPPSAIAAPGQAPSAQPGRTALQLALPLPGSADDLGTLIVSTYASASPGLTDQTSLKARTEISLTGELKTVLPSALSADDDRYLALHQAMVKEALDARLAYLALLMRSGQG